MQQENGGRFAATGLTIEDGQAVDVDGAMSDGGHEKLLAMANLAIRFVTCKIAL
jgi:hypothetical protein